MKIVNVQHFDFQMKIVYQEKIHIIVNIYQDGQWQVVIQY